MPRSHTTVEVGSLPNCDFCSNQASYDGKTTMGPWAYMCEVCFSKVGLRLGLGMGQRLEVKK
jgi:hypothetical protein